MRKHNFWSIVIVTLGALALAACSGKKAQSDQKAKEAGTQDKKETKSEKTKAQMEKERVEKALKDLKSASTKELIQKLDDKSIKVKRAAVAELGKKKPVEETALQALILCLGNENLAIRSTAIRALASIGEPAVELLIRHLRSDSPHAKTMFKIKRRGKGKRRTKKRTIRVPIQISLRQIGKPAVEPLMEVINSEDKVQRHAAISTLGMIGEHAEPAVPELLKTSTSEDSETKRRSLSSLFRISPENPKVKGALNKATKDENKRVSSLAERLLKRLEAKDKNAGKKQKGKKNKESRKKRSAGNKAGPKKD